jgi:YHS domain-containing protein
MRFIVAMFVVLLVTRPVMAFEDINTSFFGGLALGGYDAVSYYTQHQAVKGSTNFDFTWNGATWLFVNEANRERFENDPETFAPQYGGYCSNQMSLGNLSDVDPEVWRIIRGKLYLFGHDAGRVRWQTDTDQRILEADGHWMDQLTQ